MTHSKLKPGNLIQTKVNPAITGAGKEGATAVNYFFCEKTQHNYSIPVGTFGLIVNTKRTSALGNIVIDILFDEKILAIADYNDQYGNPIWCDIVQ